MAQHVEAGRKLIYQTREMSDYFWMSVLKLFAKSDESPVKTLEFISDSVFDVPHCKWVFIQSRLLASQI